MKFPRSPFSGFKLDARGMPPGARALQRSITETLAKAGLDMRSGAMRTVSDTLQKAFADAGLAGPTSVARPAGDVIDVPSREVGDVQADGPEADTRPGALPGRKLSATHTGPAGSRSYNLYIPASAGDAPRPLVVMLHGCTQSPDDFAIGTGMNALAERHGVLVAYPAQSRNANGSGCWNWFRSQDQAREGGEPALIAGIVRDIAAAHRVDTRRVFVAGLSAGGAMAAILGQTHPDLFAAVGVHSGLPYGAAHDVPSAFAAMASASPQAADGLPPPPESTGDIGTAPFPRDPQGAPATRFVPTIVFHGDRDTTVNAGNGARVVARAVAGARRDTPANAPLPASVDESLSPGGSRSTRTVHRSATGRPLVEQWVVHGAGHAWSGGDPAGTYTEPSGPDASEAMLRFFLAQTN